MSKPNRETQLRLGEQRLQEWGVGDDAGVDALRARRRPRCGRRSGDRGAPRRARRAGQRRRAARLEAGSADKLVHKEVHRSLYRLEQRGAEHSAGRAAAPRAAGGRGAGAGRLPLRRSTAAAISSCGCVKPRPGGVAHLFAVINDPDGLREVEPVRDHAQGAARVARGAAAQSTSCAWSKPTGATATSSSTAPSTGRRRSGQPMSGDYRGHARPAHQGAGDRDAAARSSRRSMSPRCAPTRRCWPSRRSCSRRRSFAPGSSIRETLQPYLDEAQQIKDSPLVLNEAQQQERFRAAHRARDRGAVRRRAASPVGCGASRRWRTSSTPPDAVTPRKRALAVALALEASTHGGRDIPLLRATRRAAASSRSCRWKSSARRSRRRSSLVVTPQQARARCSSAAARDVQAWVQRQRPWSLADSKAVWTQMAFNWGQMCPRRRSCRPVMHIDATMASTPGGGHSGTRRLSIGRSLDAWRYLPLTIDRRRMLRQRGRVERRCLHEDRPALRDGDAQAVARAQRVRVLLAGAGAGGARRPMGFHTLWEVEHHFLNEFSHSSAPEVFLAAVAARTQRMRIGHGVVLLPYPFNHPIRVAERAAVLDIMSNGRLEFGTGRSSLYEQQAFGIRFEESRSMWQEALRGHPAHVDRRSRSRRTTARTSRFRSARSFRSRSRSRIRRCGWRRPVRRAGSSPASSASARSG